MPTKNTVRTSKKTENTAKAAMKSNIDKIRALESQKAKLDADIEALRKLTDTPAELGDCMVQRRNILFFNFEYYGVKPEGTDSDPKIDVSCNLEFSPNDKFESQCSGIHDLSENNSIDEAISIAEQTIRTATDLHAKLLEAKANGCEYVVSAYYVNPENFNFHDDEN